MVLDGYLSLFMALAWPVVTLAIALIFRHDVTRALGRVGRFKYRDLEVTFQDDLRQAEELSRKLPPAVPAKDSIVLEIDPGKSQPFVRRPSELNTRVEERQSAVNLAERSPRTAIELAWKLVNRSVKRADQASLPDMETRLVVLLQTLRDRTVHLDGPSPSPDEARRFIDLAFSLASRIEGQA